MEWSSLVVSGGGQRQDANPVLDPGLRTDDATAPGGPNREEPQTHKRGYENNYQGWIRLRVLSWKSKKCVRNIEGGYSKYELIEITF